MCLQGKKSLFSLFLLSPISSLNTMEKYLQLSEERRQLGGKRVRMNARLINVPTIHKIKLEGGSKINQLS